MVEMYIPAAISSVVTATFTAIFAVIASRLNKKIDKRDEEDERKRKEQSEKEKSQLAARQAEHDALVNGLQAILRDRLVSAYNHYEEKGELPIYAMENIQKMYDAYHNLGGNGTITKLYNKLQKLPQSKEGEDRE